MNGFNQNMIKLLKYTPRKITFLVKPVAHTTHNMIQSVKNLGGKI